MTVTNVDITPLVQALIIFAATVVPTVLTALLGAVLHHIKIFKDQAAADRVSSAVGRAAGLAFGYLSKWADQNKVTVQTRDTAIAIALSYLNKGVPDAISRLNIDDEHIKNMVLGELGKLMAQSPSTVIADSVSVSAQDVKVSNGNKEHLP